MTVIDLKKLELKAEFDNQESELKLEADFDENELKADFVIDPVSKTEDSLLSVTGNESSFSGSSTTPDIHFDVRENLRTFAINNEDSPIPKSNFVSTPRINIEAADDDEVGVLANSLDRDRLGVSEKKSKRKNCRNGFSSTFIRSN